MHYIRLLRTPKLSKHAKKLQLELLLTITTDLGDSFLFPESPLELVVSIQLSESFDTGNALSIPPVKRGLIWDTGMRVLKHVLEIPDYLQRLMAAGVAVELCIEAKGPWSADHASEIIKQSQDHREEDTQGMVMPVWVAIGYKRPDDKVSIRKISWMGDSVQGVEVEEEIGESIARHVWDAGIMLLCAIAASVALPKLMRLQDRCMKTTKAILNRKEPLNILELGCGVGILGVGVGAILNQHYRGVGGRTILMTDLEEAERRARSNISHLQTNVGARNDDTLKADGGKTELLYENLNWEDGRKGDFGPQVRSRRWGLVMLSDCTYNVDMLPALVETLSAVHAANKSLGPADDPPATKVLLATKPRHSSERALFDLLASHGWSTLESQVLPLPVLGAEAESVEVYLFQKT